MTLQSHIKLAGGGLAFRTRGNPVFGVASFCVLAGIMVGCSSPSESPSEPPSEACRLIGTEQHTGGPDLLMSAYRWEGDHLAAITRTRLGTLTEEIHYTYDESGRLIAETLDQDIGRSDVSHYHVDIEYEYGPSSTSEGTRLHSARLYDSRDYQPRNLTEVADFSYSADVLQSIVYSSYEGKRYYVSYEYTGNCIFKAMVRNRDGSSMFLASEYDDHPNSGSRVFGDRFWVIPAPWSSGCDRNLTRLLLQENGPTEPADSHDVVISYAYNPNGLPSLGEYVFGDHESIEFFYDCVSE